MAVTKERRPLAALLCITLCAATYLTVSAPAIADEASGTWTGEASARGNYYWERSTRVVAPGLGIALESPDGLIIRGGYLLDAITSASIAQGAGADVAFTEVRHQFDATVSGGVGDDESGRYQLTAGGRVSVEPDYVSVSGFAGVARQWRGKTRSLSANLAYAHDEVRRNIQGGPRAGSDNTFEEALDAFALTVGYDHTFTPTLIGNLSYQVGIMGGFLANAYRTSGTGQAETHPRQRVRHTLTGSASWYIPLTDTTLRLQYRGYLDSWRIGAITPEVRLYQTFWKHIQLRTRYRFYAQTRAFFYRSDLAYPIGSEFVSIDPKMSEFQSHLVEAQLRIDFKFLRGGALSFMRKTRFDISVGHIWNSNRFGNGVIAQTGVSYPF